MRKDTIILADVILFFVVSIFVTISDAKTDVGTIIYENPWEDGGHAMTMGEAILHNLPVGLFLGIAAVCVLTLFIYIGMRVYAWAGQKGVDNEKL